MKCRDCDNVYSRSLRVAGYDGWQTMADEHGEFILCPDCLKRRRDAVKQEQPEHNPKGFTWGS